MLFCSLNLRTWTAPNIFSGQTAKGATKKMDLQYSPNLRTHLLPSTYRLSSVQPTAFPPQLLEELQRCEWPKCTPERVALFFPGRVKPTVFIVNFTGTPATQDGFWACGPLNEQAYPVMSERSSIISVQPFMNVVFLCLASMNNLVEQQH